MSSKHMIQVFLVAISFSVFAPAGAQSLYFCESYDSTGAPESISERWLINSGGGYIYFLFDNETAITTGEVFFYIDRKKEGTFHEYDVRSLNPGEDKTWLVLDYKIKDPGQYRITVLDEKQTELVSEMLTVSPRETKLVPAFYKDSQTVFCNSVNEEGEAVEPIEKISLPASGEAEATLLLRQDQPLKTSRLIVDVWTVKEGRLEEFLETLYADADPGLGYASLDYTFFSEGKFRFMIYNEDQVFIKSGELSIER